MGFWDVITGIGSTIQSGIQKVGEAVGGAINQGIASIERTFKIDLPGGLTKDRLKEEKKPATPPPTPPKPTPQPTPKTQFPKPEFQPAMTQSTAVQKGFENFVPSPPSTKPIVPIRSPPPQKPERAVEDVKAAVEAAVRLAEHTYETAKKTGKPTTSFVPLTPEEVRTGNVPSGIVPVATVFGKARPTGRTETFGKAFVEATPERVVYQEIHPSGSLQSDYFEKLKESLIAQGFEYKGMDVTKKGLIVKFEARPEKGKYFVGYGEKSFLKPISKEEALKLWKEGKAVFEREGKYYTFIEKPLVRKEIDLKQEILEREPVLFFGVPISTIFEEGYPQLSRPGAPSKNQRINKNIKPISGSIQNISQAESPFLIESIEPPSYLTSAVERYKSASPLDKFLIHSPLGIVPFQTRVEGLFKGKPQKEVSYEYLTQMFKTAEKEGGKLKPLTAFSYGLQAAPTTLAASAAAGVGIKALAATGSIGAVTIGGKTLPITGAEIAKGAAIIGLGTFGAYRIPEIYETAQRDIEKAQAMIISDIVHMAVAMGAAGVAGRYFKSKPPQISHTLQKSDVFLPKEIRAGTKGYAEAELLTTLGKEGPFVKTDLRGRIHFEGLKAIPPEKAWVKGMYGAEIEVWKPRSFLSRLLGSEIYSVKTSDTLLASKGISTKYGSLIRAGEEFPAYAFKAIGAEIEPAYLRLKLLPSTELTKPGWSIIMERVPFKIQQLFASKGFAQKILRVPKEGLIQTKEGQVLTVLEKVRFRSAGIAATEQGRGIFGGPQHVWIVRETTPTEQFLIRRGILPRTKPFEPYSLESSKLLGDFFKLVEAKPKEIRTPAGSLLLEQKPVTKPIPTETAILGAKAAQQQAIQTAARLAESILIKETKPPKLPVPIVGTPQWVAQSPFKTPYYPVLSPITSPQFPLIQKPQPPIEPINIGEITKEKRKEARLPVKPRITIEMPPRLEIPKRATERGREMVEKVKERFKTPRVTTKPSLQEKYPKVPISIPIWFEKPVLGEDVIPSNILIQTPKELQRLIQQQKLKQVQAIHTAIQPPTPVLPPFEPSIVSPPIPKLPKLLPGVKGRGGLPKVEIKLKRKKTKKGITPLADWLSKTITEAITKKPAHHPAPTPKIKRMFAHKLRVEPFFITFPTAEMLKGKVRVKPNLSIGKGVMNLAKRRKRRKRKKR